MTYKVVSKKLKLKINAKTGKIKIKKKAKKGTYKLKVKVFASGNNKYNALTKTVKFKLIVQ